MNEEDLLQVAASVLIFADKNHNVHKRQTHGISYHEIKMIAPEVTRIKAVEFYRLFSSLNERIERLTGFPLFSKGRHDRTCDLTKKRSSRHYVFSNEQHVKDYLLQRQLPMMTKSLPSSTIAAMSTITSFLLHRDDLVAKFAHQISKAELKEVKQISCKQLIGDSNRLSPVVQLSLLRRQANRDDVILNHLIFQQKRVLEEILEMSNVLYNHFEIDAFELRNWCSFTDSLLKERPLFAEKVEELTPPTHRATCNFDSIFSQTEEIGSLQQLQEVFGDKYPKADVNSLISIVDIDLLCKKVLESEENTFTIAEIFSMSLSNLSERLLPPQRRATTRYSLSHLDETTCKKVVKYIHKEIKESSDLPPFSDIRADEGWSSKKTFRVEAAKSYKDTRVGERFNVKVKNDCSVEIDRDGQSIERLAAESAALSNAISKALDILNCCIVNCFEKKYNKRLDECTEGEVNSDDELSVATSNLFCVSSDVSMRSEDSSRSECILRKDTYLFEGSVKINVPSPLIFACVSLDMVIWRFRVSASLLTSASNSDSSPTALRSCTATPYRTIKIHGVSDWHCQMYFRPSWNIAEGQHVENDMLITRSNFVTGNVELNKMLYDLNFFPYLFPKAVFVNLYDNSAEGESELSTFSSVVVFYTPILKVLACTRTSLRLVSDFLPLKSSFVGCVDMLEEGKFPVFDASLERHARATLILRNEAYSII